MKYIIAALLTLSSLTSFALTRLQCDQVDSVEPTHQRLFILLDSYNRILILKNTVFSDVEQKVVAQGAGSFKANTAREAIAYEAEDGTLVYNYQTSHSCGTDDQTDLTDVMVILSQKLLGPASAMVTEVKNETTRLYNLNCVVL